MDIGLVVYSDTGNTLAAAERLKAKLAGDGHAPGLVRLVSNPGYRPGGIHPGFRELPSLESYQAVVFAAPVNAFSLCRPMKEYLRTVGSLGGKRIAFLVTEFFPYAWLGGRQAVAWMRKACLERGGDVAGYGIVNWSGSDRETRIEAAVREIAGCFSGNPRAAAKTRKPGRETRAGKGTP